MHPSHSPSATRLQPHAAASPVAGIIPCANCGAHLSHAYCPMCGQSARSPIGSFRAFASQLLDEVASLDSRLLRSLRALLFAPGRLTREYLDGRRVAYTQPVQLYLTAAAVFFLVASYRPFVRIDTSTLRVVGELPGITVQNEEVRERLLALPTDPTALALFAERFESTINGLLPVFLVGFVLLYSGFVYVVNRHRERRYLPHAVFTLHWTAFTLLVIAAFRLLPGAWRVDNLSLIVMMPHLTLALRRVYGGGVLANAAKAALLLVALLAFLGIWVQTSVLIGNATT